MDDEPAVRTALDRALKASGLNLRGSHVSLSVVCCDSLMNWKSKPMLAVGIAVLAFAAGGTALATGQSGSATKPRAAGEPFLSGVAKRLNVSPDALLDAMKAEATARVDAAVAAGQLPEAVAAQLKARIARATLDQPFGLLAGGPRGKHHGRMGFHAVERAAANYIGITPAELRTALFAGTSLAQQAREHGKSVDGLKQAIVDAVSKQLDQTRLSPERKQRILDRLKSRIDEIVNRSFRRR